MKMTVIKIDGDANILDGIDVIFSPGHSVGGQSVVVNTSGGRAIITGFCCNDKNFPATGPAIAPGVHIDLTEAYDSIQKIRQMADILIPLHDLSVGRMEEDTVVEVGSWNVEVGDRPLNDRNHLKFPNIFNELKYYNYQKLL